MNKIQTLKLEKCPDCGVEMKPNGTTPKIAGKIEEYLNGEEENIYQVFRCESCKKIVLGKKLEVHVVGNKKLVLIQDAYGGSGWRDIKELTTEARKEEIINCTHTNTSKMGQRSYASGIFQMRLCKDCGLYHRAEKLTDLPIHMVKSCSH